MGVKKRGGEGRTFAMMERSVRSKAKPGKESDLKKLRPAENGDSGSIMYEE